MENLPFFGTASLPIELAPVGLRLARDADRLCAAIDFLAKLNERILARDTVGASACFAQFRERFGLSLLVAGKAMSARHASADDGGRKDFGDVIAPFLSPRRQVAAVAFEDSVDPGRGYIHVRRSFMRFVSENRLRDYDVPIVVDLLSPLAEQISNYSQRLQAYGRWSLIDVTAYLFRLRHILDAEGRGADVSAIDAVIPEAVRTAWTSSFDAKVWWEGPDCSRTRRCLPMHQLGASIPKSSNIDSELKGRLAFGWMGVSRSLERMRRLWRSLALTSGRCF
jgi:hypothetical protein